MPDVSYYIKINDKNNGKCIVEVKDAKTDSTCRKGVFHYGMILLSWLLVGLLLFSITLAVRKTCKHEGFQEEWQNYKAVHGKNYSQEEDEVRICIYLANKMNVEDHNNLFQAGIESYQKEINIFSDFTPEELDGIRGFRADEGSAPAEAFFYREDAACPESFDWRLKGAVAGVKNQGLCGSCYAFSATGSLEAQHFLKTGKMVSLSEQNLVDCSTPQGNKGCKGGTMINSFSYILKNKGLDTEQSYPYEGVEGSCRFERGTVGATIQGYRSVSPSERALQAAVVDVGPISVGIDATSNFLQYKTGIFNDNNCSPYTLNHAVLVVGYGSEGGQDYWIVKNSWGTNWGEGGYIRIVRNRGNKCGIASMASYPLL